VYYASGMLFVLLAFAQPQANLQAQIAELRERLDALEGRPVVQLDDLATVDCDMAVCPIRIAPGRYERRAPVEICRPLDVDAYGVEIHFFDSSGVIIRRDEECNAERSSWRGGHLVAHTSTTVVPRPIGFDIQASVHVEDLQVARFVRGVRAFCSTSRAGKAAERAAGFEVSDQAHCNRIVLENVSATGSHLDGFYIRGANANAGTVIAANAVHNCAWASSYLPPPNYEKPTAKGAGVCANIRDQSFLGNTWIGPHSAASYDYRSSKGEKVRWYQYFSASANGRTTWIGPYAENGADDGQSGNGPSYMLGYGHLVFGGINNIRSPRGMTIGEWGTISRAVFRAAKGNAALALGEASRGASPFTLAYRDQNVRFEIEPHDDGRLELELGNATRSALGYLQRTDLDAGTVQWRAPRLRTLLPDCPKPGTRGVLRPLQGGVAALTDAEGTSLCALRE